MLEAIAPIFSSDFQKIHSDDEEKVVQVLRTVGQVQHDRFTEANEFFTSETGRFSYPYLFYSYVPYSDLALMQVTDTEERKNYVLGVYAFDPDDHRSHIILCSSNMSSVTEPYLVGDTLTCPPHASVLSD